MKKYTKKTTPRLIPILLLSILHVQRLCVANHLWMHFFYSFILYIFCPKAPWRRRRRWMRGGVKKCLKASWRRCYCPHPSRDLLSPVCTKSGDWFGFVFSYIGLEPQNLWFGTQKKLMLLLQIFSIFRFIL